MLIRPTVCRTFVLLAVLLAPNEGLPNDAEEDSNDQELPNDAEEDSNAQEEADWNFSTSFGVAISNLVEPKFVISGEGDAASVVRAVSVEDDRRFDVVPLVHYVFDQEDRGGTRLETARKGWAFTAGLGGIQDESLSILYGLSYHFGHDFYLTFGYELRAVKTLPSEQALDAPPIRDNVLTDLPLRRERGSFFSFTYAINDPHRGSGN